MVNWCPRIVQEADENEKNEKHESESHVPTNDVQDGATAEANTAGATATAPAAGASLQEAREFGSAQPCDVGFAPFPSLSTMFLIIQSIHRLQIQSSW